MEPETKPSLSARIPSEQRGLLRILGSFFLGALFSHLFSRSSAPPTNKSGGAGHLQDIATNPGQNRQDIAPLRIIVDRIPEPLAPTPEERARENRREGREQHHLWVQICIAFFAFVYATIAICQWKTQRDTLIASERPWIGIEENPHIEFTLDGKQFRGAVNAVIRNFGKSPASSIYPSAHFIPMTNFEDIKKVQDEMCSSTPITMSRTSTGTIVGWKAKGYAIEGGYTLFPNDTNPIAMADGPAPWNASPSNIVNAVGCITYSDQFGKTVPLHHTRFCYQGITTSPTEFGPCPWGNNAN